jgi:hypothetical protein
MFCNTSSRQGPPGPGRGLVLFGRMLRRAASAAVALIVCVLFGAGAALAYWPAAGTGNTTAAVGTLAPPTNVSGSAISSNVSVSWTASAGPLAPTGYYVTRITGRTPMPACGSGPAVLITATSCTDTAPAGSHDYQVTAVYRSWTAVSQANAHVNVVLGLSDKLAFSPQPPASATAGSPLSSFSVRLQNLAGLSVWQGGVPITISIGANPGGDTLAGTLTATTSPFGVATFGDVRLTKAGAGYTLVASSAGYAGAVSTGFAVTAAAATQLVVTPPSSVMGEASATANVGPFTVERRDTYGNPATGAAVNVTLASGTAGTGLFATSANGTTGVTSVNIPAGLASTTFHYGNTKSGSTPFTVSGIGQPLSVPVEITAATPRKLAFVAIPATIPLNAPFDATVRILDAFDNQTQSPAAVTLTSSGPTCLITVPAPNPKAAAAGSVSFTGLTINGKRSGCQLTAASTGLTGVASSVFETGNKV